MGIISSLQLFHQNIKQDKEGFPFTSKLEAKGFTTEDLYPLLKKELVKDKEYHLNKLSEESIELEEIVTGKSVFNRDTFYLSMPNEQDIHIKSDTLSPILYELLSYFTVLDHECYIEWNGKHPFLNPKNIDGHQQGHYHYACVLKPEQIYAYVNDTLHNFENYNQYWELTIFHENLEININNHCSGIYKDNKKAKDKRFAIAINELQQNLKITKQAHSENNGSYYFQPLDLATTLQLLQTLFNELIEAGSDYFLTAFTPKIQPYYEIEVVIKNTTIDSIVELIQSSRSFMQGSPLHYNFQPTEQGMTITSSYQQKNIGYSEIIKNEDIAKGHIYLGKIYSETLFESLQKTIATHFCPCYIQTEDAPITIYYKNSQDKTLIENYFQSFEGYEHWLEGFIKV